MKQTKGKTMFLLIKEAEQKWQYVLGTTENKAKLGKILGKSQMHLLSTYLRSI